MKIALRLLLREWRAGELRLLFGALLVAVAAITTVGFFIDRVQLALTTQTNQLLAADLLLIADHPIPDVLSGEARQRGLQQANTLAFPSMVVRGARNQLADVKAVGEGYPLRGELEISTQAFAPGQAQRNGPAPGTAWADERLAQILDLKLGDAIALGQIELTISGIITREPDRAGDFFNIAPRLMVNLNDIPRTQLIQPGSRIGYRLLLAGEGKQIEAYRQWVEKRLQRGERMQGIADARPEIRNAMERAQRYLGLAALVSAILAGVAVALAGRQYLARHLDSCAVLRCLGAQRATLLRMYLVQFVLLGLVASLSGSLLGYGGQALLAEMLRGHIVNELPPPSLWPLLEAIVIGELLLLAFVLPPLLHLVKVPTLRVLRRDLGTPQQQGLLWYGVSALVVIGILIQRAGEVKLGLFVLGGLLGVVMVGLLAAWLLLRLLASLRLHAHGVWFYGLANVARRRAASLTQILGFALGLMALLLLTLVRNDLLAGWQAALPADAPNRFVVNIQPDQLTALQQFFQNEQLATPKFYPMIRGRLVAVNGKEVLPQDYAEERAQRLVQREFNLSVAEKPRPDYRFSAGRWWRDGEATQQFSVEEGLAKTLNIHLGDELTYDIAGARVSGRVANLRKVAWDTMQVNFFVIAPPPLLQGRPATYITSFHLPQGQEARLNRMLREFPNLTIIDVASIIRDVRTIMDRVNDAVTFIFVFTLLAGLVVLYAAVLSTRQERLYEAAVMRTLGARTRQLAGAQWIEFAVLGAIAGLLAATGASLSAWALAQHVLNLPFSFNPWVWVVGVAGGAAGITFAGLLATRSVLRVPPLGVLRTLS